MLPIPSPQQVVEFHRPLFRMLIEAIRLGTIHAQEYSDWKDESVDRALAPALVRKGARRYLVAKEQDVHNEGEFDYEAEFLSNLGLSVTALGVQVRILRSAQGDLLPVPGQSIARQEFYHQFGLFNEMMAQAFPDPDALPLRLVLHWSTDAEYSLARVWLACPMSGDITRESVKAHWDWPIWRRHDVTANGQVQAEVTDLDIFLEDEATGSQG